MDRILADIGKVGSRFSSTIGGHKVGLRYRSKIDRILADIGNDGGSRFSSTDKVSPDPPWCTVVVPLLSEVIATGDVGGSS